MSSIAETRRVINGPGWAPRAIPKLFPLSSSDWFLFVIGATVFHPIHLIGDLPVGEIILVLALPFLLRQHAKVLLHSKTRTIFILMGIWLLSQMISDMVNGSPIDSRLKGMARVIFFACDLAGFSILIGRNTKRILVIALGLASSEALGLMVNRVTGPDAWKFGGAIAASMFATIIGSYLCVRRRYLIYVLLMAFLAACNLHYGYRSQIAIDLVTLVLSLPFFAEANARRRAAAGMKKVSRMAAQRPAASMKSILRLATLLLFSLGAVWLSQKIIHVAVERGYFEAAIEQKFQAQASGQMGVLFGARPEIPVAIQAIKDAPLLGHGSYAVDPKYVIMLQDYQYRFGYSGSDEPEDFGVAAGIPTHSHLTANWVDGGVLASFFWFYLLWLIVVAIKVISETRLLLAPLYAYLFVTFFWDILFSPFGYDRRIYEAFFIVLLVNLTSSPALASAGSRVYARARPYVKRIYRATPNRPDFRALPRPR